MAGFPTLLGIVNITPDSFSDGGRYVRPEDAIRHGRALLDQGADVIDLGPASSNPDAAPVNGDEEMRRLAPVLAAFKHCPERLSIDSFDATVQRHALSQGVGYLNDIHGFPDPALYPALAASDCKLIVMHAVQERGIATRIALSGAEAWTRISAFFRQRLAALDSAGIARDRLILDPGMGFFLSSLPEASVQVLAGIARLKRDFGLPILVSVSRKSFIRRIVGREASDSGPATLAAELYAADAGVDYIRTHDPAALKDALRVTAALNDARSP
jgi:dihydropteroate synthase